MIAPTYTENCTDCGAYIVFHNYRDMCTECGDKVVERQTIERIAQAKAVPK